MTGWRITRKRLRRRDPEDFGSAKATKRPATRQDAQEMEKAAKEEARYARTISYSSAYARTAWDNVAAHFAVAADAWEEAGDRSRSLDMKCHMRRALRKGSYKEKPLSKERLERFYKFHRRQGKTPKRAVELARVQASKHVVGHVGDVSWPEEDGGPVYRLSDGTYELEYVQRIGGAKPFRIFRVNLAREPVDDWINVREVAENFGISQGHFRKMWSNPRAVPRALAREMVGMHYGWYNLDTEPLDLTRSQIQERYRKGVPKNDPNRFRLTRKRRFVKRRS